MYFNIEIIGKLPGPTNEFERSLVFETGEFERPKFDCISVSTYQKLFIFGPQGSHHDSSVPAIGWDWRSKTRTSLKSAILFF